MKIRTSLKSMWAACLCLGMTALAPIAHANPNCEVREFSEKSGKIVSAALSFINEYAFEGALLRLKPVLDMPDLCPYERSMVLQMIGTAEYELNNYDAAITAFEAAINAGGLLPAEASSLRVNIAQLHIANSDFAKGAQMLEDWHETGGKLNSQYIEMLWQAWAQAEQYDRAVPWAQKWFDTAVQKELKHYELMNFLYMKTNQPEKQAEMMEWIRILSTNE